MGMTAVAFGAPPEGKGPPEGHGPPTGGEIGNNVSVPLVMINGDFELGCPTNAFSAFDLVAGDPDWYDAACAPLPDGEYCVAAGFYFVQGVDQWQAPCMDMVYAPDATELIDVFGQWGDNLAGDAKFKVGSPIRVELTLWDYYQHEIALTDNTQFEPQLGYRVIKLEPSELDRASAYGTLATAVDPEAEIKVYEATAIPMAALIHDGDATFSVYHVDTATYAVPLGTNPTSEINATGKVVYGYNLRVGEPGVYDITFTVPNVNLLGCLHTEGEGESCLGNTTTIRINVTSGGGGGGKK
jgi:hypothetical protein